MDLIVNERIVIVVQNIIKNINKVKKRKVWRIIKVFKNKVDLLVDVLYRKEKIIVIDFQKDHKENFYDYHNFRIEQVYV